MKKSFSIFLISLMMLTSLFPAFAFEKAYSKTSYSESQSIEGELIVSVRSSARIHSEMSYESINKESNEHIKLISNSGFEVKKALFSSDSKAGGVINATDFNKTAIENLGHVYLVSYASNFSSSEKATAILTSQLMEKGFDVNYIEPNYLVEASDYNDNRQAWHYDMIRVDEAWTITTGNQNTYVAILDTGIDFNHESLNRLVDTSKGKNFTTNNPNDFMDRHSHGTHVAGTVAAYNKISGVAKDINLIPVKVLSDSGSGSSYGIQQGIIHAANVGADVINMSLGGGSYSQATFDACQFAVDRGVIIVAASGNNSRNSISYPAAYENVISVGAVGQSKRRASFSNYGTGLDIVAPGVGIFSAIPNNRYGSKSGTSMASPHVAGVVGLMKSLKKDLTLNETRSILWGTAQKIGDQWEYGYGLVDAYEAVKALYSGNPEKEKFRGSLKANKSQVTQGEPILFTASVENEKNEPVKDATVEMILTTVDGTLIQSWQKTTDTQGLAQHELSDTSHLAIGSYKLMSKISKTGYEDTQFSTTFSVTQIPSEPKLMVTFKAMPETLKRGEKISFLVLVTDEMGRPVNKANVQFKLVFPSGDFISPWYKQTDADGNLSLDLMISEDGAIGTYQAIVIVKKYGYDTVSQSQSFHVIQ